MPVVRIARRAPGAWEKMRAYRGFVEMSCLKWVERSRKRVILWTERCWKIRCRISGGRSRRALARGEERCGRESRFRRSLSSGELRARILLLMVRVSML
jgi:hypothetical protein